jgi:peroxiredoxin Q/BCP
VQPILPPGTPAPGFTLPAHTGADVSLHELLGFGHPVYLWWYPKALSGGCTACGRSLRGRMARFAEFNCLVLGATFDPPEVNAEFARRAGLEFPLLSATPEVAEEWAAKREEGDPWSVLPRRVAYLVSPDGLIERSYVVGDPARQAQRVLDDLRALTSPPPGEKKKFRLFRRG